MSQRSKPGLTKVLQQPPVCWCRKVFELMLRQEEGIPDNAALEQPQRGLEGVWVQALSIAAHYDCLQPGWAEADSVRC